MHADEVLSGEELDARQCQRKREAIGRDPLWRDTVHVGGDTVDGRLVGADDADQHDRRTSVR